MGLNVQTLLAIQREGGIATLAHICYLSPLPIAALQNQTQLCHFANASSGVGGCSCKPNSACPTFTNII